MTHHHTPPHPVTIARPVRTREGAYVTLALPHFPLRDRMHTSLKVVTGVPPAPLGAPPPIPLSTGEPLDVLRLLEIAGVRYLHPDAPAATQGVEIFTAGRTFALEKGPEWVGFDFDFTTNIYRIYSPILSLISIKLLPSFTHRLHRRDLRFFEAAKPGMHELIMGMAVGYALRQGLRTFKEWELYRPQVRFVTQTWPDRLAKLAMAATPLIALAMGRYPGTPLTDHDIRVSDTFITIEDFLQQQKKLLTRFRDGGYRFQVLAEREQDEVHEMLMIEKGYMLKPLSTFTAKGWTPPKLIFDDSPASNARLLKDGVCVVSTLNPVAPGRELSDIKALSLFGRTRAARQMIHMASRTEGPALIDALHRLAEGATRVTLDPHRLTPTPHGTIFMLHDLRGSLRDVLANYRVPQQSIARMIKAIIAAAGGRERITREYHMTAEFRKHRSHSL